MAVDMFSDIVKEFKGAVSEMRHGTATETLTFAKPYCTPARGIIEPVLAKYGVKVYGFSEEPARANPLNLFKGGQKMVGDYFFTLPDALPVAQVAKITVSREAAAWCEYLLLRTGKLKRIGHFIDKRNEAWAAKHDGQMPPAWNDGAPWIEKSCSDGVNAWTAAKKAFKNAQKGKGRK